MQLVRFWLEESEAFRKPHEAFGEVGLERLATANLRQPFAPYGASGYLRLFDNLDDLPLERAESRGKKEKPI